MAYTTDQVGGFYKKYLGRDLQNPGEAQGWLENPDAENMIKNSGEAQAYTKKQASGGALPAQPSTQPNGALPGPTANSTAPAGGYDYNKLQAAWLAAAPGTKIEDFAAAHPEFAQGVSSSNNGEWMNLPGGQSFDAFKDYGAGGQNKTQFGDQGHDYATGRALTPQESAQAENSWAQSNGVAQGGGGSSSGTSTSSSGPIGGPVAPGQMQGLLDTLLARSKQSLNINPATDSVIRPQLDAAAAENTRTGRNMANDLAESGNPYNTGADTTARTQIAEKGAQANNSLQAQLVQNELTSRRTEIQNALTEMGSLLTTQQQMSLTKELAELDAAIKRESMNMQNSQFGAQLGFNYNQFDWLRDPHNPNNIPNFNG